MVEFDYHTFCTQNALREYSQYWRKTGHLHNKKKNVTEEAPSFPKSKFTY